LSTLSTIQDTTFPLEPFYDAMELSPGDPYQDHFKEAIDRGILLAIVSDTYDTRPWCVFELATAKRARRPIVLADVGRVRTSRTYPYGAKLPRVHVSADRPPEEWTEPLLVETLSEGRMLGDVKVAACGGKRRRYASGPSANWPREDFDKLEMAMTPEQIATAQKLAAAWKPTSK
jgi:hypothetical protein